MSRATIALALTMTAALGTLHAQEATELTKQERINKIRALDWVAGPKQITIAGNSTLTLPDGYLYLDPANTAKYEELNHNLSDGKEVLIAPKNSEWNAYFVFENEGYVKDDEKINADAILKSLTDSTEAANEERRRRGWPDLHVVGWSMPPAYNSTSKRLEWATRLQSQNHENTNFFTKVLGRKGVTTVVLVSSPQNLQASIADLNNLLADYHFKSGDTYADWRPGDKVAEYGLTGLIVGGAVAAAVKTGLFKGLWKVLLAGAAAFWKLLLVAFAAVVGGFRSLFRRKKV